MSNNPLITRTLESKLVLPPASLTGMSLCILCLGLLLDWSAVLAQEVRAESIAANLIFHASFDHSSTADFAKGDPQLFVASSIDARSTSEPFLDQSSFAKQTSEDGRFGGCIRFLQPTKNVIFYKAFNNFPNPAELGTATVSFWLKADTVSGLVEGFCDPIQITSKQWDDASFFVEFEKRGARVPFRLGVYADKQVWNPQGIDFAAIPPEKRPLVSVEQPPFSKNRWTHVAFTFANFNNGQSNGSSDLYLDGALVGSLAPRLQTFTWDIEKAAIMIGLNYVGAMDDLSIFNRALSAKEIEWLSKQDGGVNDLKSK